MGQLEEYEQYLEDMERARYQDREKLRAAIIEENRLTYEAHQKAWKKTQRVAYKQSVAQMQDAMFEAAELNLQSEEFLIATGQRTQTQVTKYAASGAMVKGSALARMDMTRSLGAEGARRLARRASLRLDRGRLEARTTRRVFEPMGYRVRSPGLLEARERRPVHEMAGRCALCDRRPGRQFR